MRIMVDEDPLSPRDWDNCGIIATWHKRYKLGDVQPECSPKEYISSLSKSVILSVYMMDHGGLTLSTTPFACSWDSRQLGIIFMPPGKLESEFGGDVEKATRCLESEIETYGHYVAGEVYGFILDKEVTCPHCNNTEWEDVDSCWGFYGYDPEENGISGYVEDWASWKEGRTPPTV